MLNASGLNKLFFFQLKVKDITLSTVITLARIALVPFIILAMLNHEWGTACVFFVIAGITDALDGLLARLLNEQTFLGALLDPLADKLLIIATYSTLSFVHSPLFIIPHWFVYLVLTKELLQIMGVMGLISAKGFIAIRATALAKTTMLVQWVFILWLFICYFMHWLPVKTYYSMLGIVLCLVIACFVQYAVRGYAILKEL
jgi:cardiolipin synthase (CMP-forming)